eukprot:CAMPEP_0176044660 /NCGR_PEP_ID=MMETSP0120_2-20121206/22166_1 /TAXON_ID=160619 /ORGANISM="Kryptoperidinium foliaceum, Strain CCMP 1326" /LENGTH=988 /DNA_ID=CAMNT_0017378065 /DNA_START=99 /DNA_END=3065 /DNA_ORIENTATION=-
MAPIEEGHRKRVEVAYEEPSDAHPFVHGDPTLKTQRGGVDLAAAAAHHPAGSIVALGDVAVLPEAHDNCAILRETLDAKTRIRLFDGQVVTIASAILEGHRIAVEAIPRDAHLLSWGLTFGRALRDIAPGEYICNEGMLGALRLRHIEHLPEHGNFEDLIPPHVFDEASFCPAEQVPLLPADQRLTFMGFDRRSAQGGVGTRNCIAVVPTSALSAPLARRVAKALHAEASQQGSCDGVVALAHTEAAGEAGSEAPQNWDLLLRTLAGFVSHPNVAAALVVGYDGELLTPSVLEKHMQATKRPLPKWCKFLYLAGIVEEDVASCCEVLRPWILEVAQCERTVQPLSELRVALQCGGSDAFSGVSGNPAAGCAAKALIEHGGAAVLAETDELMGAESYILSRVRNAETVRRFLQKVDRYKELFAWHGQSAESNPSGGNKLRGLYNIALKSLGAGKKKHADVALDGVLEYGERLPDGERGYYFMDSPGNDLESVAGQVASGCNAIFFITGNGSITNFPFVPTLKIITTTERYELLHEDMDFNAGRYQDSGIPMAQLGAELFDHLLRMASGERTLGELAGHSQVSIWRTWAQCSAVVDASRLRIGETGAAPLLSAEAAADADEDIAILRQAPAECSERVGLVLPTSLCSAEVARMVAEKLNECRSAGGAEGLALAAAFDRFVALPHTEGCAVGYAEDGEAVFARVIFGHLLHSSVSRALMLEHGCEKMHNAWMLDGLEKRGVDSSQFGWASVQLDGGITKVVAKAREWFAEAAGLCPGSAVSPSVSLTTLPVALMAAESGTGGAAARFAAAFARVAVASGGTALLQAGSPLLRAPALLDELCAGVAGTAKPSLAFAQQPTRAGLHIMDVPPGATSRAEIITGFVGAGAGIVIVLADITAKRATALPAVGHPLVPVLHISVSEDMAPAGEPTGQARYDLRLARRAGEDEDVCRRRWLQEVVELIGAAVGRRIKPLASEAAVFQIARGPSGFST